jgi:hypothetical protein
VVSGNPPIQRNPPRPHWQLGTTRRLGSPNGCRGAVVAFRDPIWASGFAESCVCTVRTFHLFCSIYGSCVVVPASMSPVPFQEQLRGFIGCPCQKLVALAPSATRNASSKSLSVLCFVQEPRDIAKESCSRFLVMMASDWSAARMVSVSVLRMVSRTSTTAWQHAGYYRRD